MRGLARKYSLPGASSTVSSGGIVSLHSTPLLQLWRFSSDQTAASQLYVPIQRVPKNPPESKKLDAYLQSLGSSGASLSNTGLDEEKPLPVLGELDEQHAMRLIDTILREFDALAMLHVLHCLHGDYGLGSRRSAAILRAFRQTGEGEHLEYCRKLIQRNHQPIPTRTAGVGTQFACLGDSNDIGTRFNSTKRPKFQFESIDEINYCVLVCVERDQWRQAVAWYHTSQDFLGIAPNKRTFHLLLSTITRHQQLRKASIGRSTRHIIHAQEPLDDLLFYLLAEMQLHGFSLTGREESAALPPAGVDDGISGHVHGSGDHSLSDMLLANACTQPGERWKQLFSIISDLLTSSASSSSSSILLAGESAQHHPSAEDSSSTGSFSHPIRNPAFAGTDEQKKYQQQKQRQQQQQLSGGKWVISPTLLHQCLHALLTVNRAEEVLALYDTWHVLHKLQQPLIHGGAVTTSFKYQAGVPMDHPLLVEPLGLACLMTNDARRLFRLVCDNGEASRSFSAVGIDPRTEGDEVSPRAEIPESDIIQRVFQHFCSPTAVNSSTTLHTRGLSSSIKGSDVSTGEHLLTRSGHHIGLALCLFIEHGYVKHAVSLWNHLLLANSFLAVQSDSSADVASAEGSRSGFEKETGTEAETGIEIPSGEMVQASVPSKVEVSRSSGILADALLVMCHRFKSMPHWTAEGRKSVGSVSPVSAAASFAARSLFGVVGVGERVSETDTTGVTRTRVAAVAAVDSMSLSEPSEELPGPADMPVMVLDPGGSTSSSSRSTSTIIKSCSSSSSSSSGGGDYASELTKASGEHRPNLNANATSSSGGNTAQDLDPISAKWPQSARIWQDLSPISSFPGSFDLSFDRLLCHELISLFARVKDASAASSVVARSLTQRVLIPIQDVVTVMQLLRDDGDAELALDLFHLYSHQLLHDGSDTRAVSVKDRAPRTQSMNISGKTSSSSSSFPSPGSPSPPAVGGGGAVRGIRRAGDVANSRQRPISVGREGYNLFFAALQCLRELNRPDDMLELMLLTLPLTCGIHPTPAMLLLGIDALRCAGRRREAIDLFYAANDAAKIGQDLRASHAQPQPQQLHGKAQFAESDLNPSEGKDVGTGEWKGKGRGRWRGKRIGAKTAKLVIGNLEISAAHPDSYNCSSSSSYSSGGNRPAVERNNKAGEGGARGKKGLRAEDDSKSDKGRRYPMKMIKMMKIRALKGVGPNAAMLRDLLSEPALVSVLLRCCAEGRLGYDAVKIFSAREELFQAGCPRPPAGIVRKDIERVLVALGTEDMSHFIAGFLRSLSSLHSPVTLDEKLLLAALSSAVAVGKSEVFQAVLTAYSENTGRGVRMRAMRGAVQSDDRVDKRGDSGMLANEGKEEDGEEEELRNLEGVLLEGGDEEDSSAQGMEIDAEALRDGDVNGKVDGNVNVDLDVDVEAIVRTVQRLHGLESRRAWEFIQNLQLLSDP